MKENIMNEVKRFVVTYDHKDGRSGKVNVEITIQKNNDSKYGNGKSGKICVDGCERFYDLRYCNGNLYRLMIEEYFGKGLVDVVEL